MLGRLVLRDAMLRIAPQDEAERQTRSSLHVMRGHGPSKTGVNALMSRPSRLDCHRAHLIEMAGT